MIRRNFIKGFSVLTTKDLLINALQPLSKEDTRAYWLQTLTRIVTPVLDALSRDGLKKDMPVEAFGDTHENRKKVTYLEAFGRSLAGLAPWSSLGQTTQPKESQELSLSSWQFRRCEMPSRPPLWIL